MKKTIAIGSLLALLTVLSGCTVSNSGVKLANSFNQLSTGGLATSFDEINGHGWIQGDSDLHDAARAATAIPRAPIALLHGLCAGVSVYATYIPFTPAWFAAIVTDSEMDCWAPENGMSRGIFFQGEAESALLPSCDHGDSWERKDGRCTKRGEDDFARADRLKIFDAKLELAAARRSCRKTSDCTDVYLAEQKVRRLEKRALATLIARR